MPSPSSLPYYTRLVNENNGRKELMNVNLSQLLY